MDAQLNVVHNNMFAGFTVKCDPEMILSNGAEVLLILWNVVIWSLIFVTGRKWTKMILRVFVMFCYLLESLMIQLVLFIREFD